MRPRVTAVALCLATILVAAPALAPGRQAPPTPLQLFQKLLPVIRHPRCSNCHGGTDPFIPRNHRDTITTEDCTMCHNDMNAWSLASQPHSFPGKTDKELCTLYSDFAMHQGHPLFITNHMTRDEFVIAAFLGEIGGARTSPINKPPVSQAVFIQLAQDWLSQGQGACVVDGTITQEETVKVDEHWQTAPNTDWTVQQDGTRSVTITLTPSGQYHADITLKGTNILTQVQHSMNAQGVPCTVTSITTDRYTGAATGPASVRIKDAQLFAGTTPPQKDYRIDVTLPMETTTVTETNTAADQCGFGMKAGDGGVQSFDWPGWTFTIEGHMQDPTYPHIWGACDKIMKSSDVGNPALNRPGNCFRFPGVGSREPWLLNHAAGASYHDGSDVPFRVVTQWNIAYHP